MNLDNYRHRIPIQIRFSDIDRLNHVNNACYLNYFELGRVRYFNDVFRNAINWKEKGFVLARTEMDHLEPIFLNDEVYCFTRVSKIGNKSLTVSNSIVKIVNEKTVECACGIGVLVCMDYSKKNSMELPGEWIDLVRKFEGDGI